MARIRSLKPEFWDDRKLARCTTRDARMLYMGMWNQADEHGRLNGDSFWLKGRVFPYDDDVTTEDVSAMLGELERAGRIQRYDVDDDPFIYLPKLAKHQRLEPAKVDSRLPEPPAHAPAQTNTSLHADSSEPRADESAPDDNSSSLLYVPGSMGQGSGSKGQVGAAPNARRGTRIPEGWTPDTDLITEMRTQGIPDELARAELPRFRDYWSAKSGKDATKVDWRATWRNWLRTAAERAGPSATPGVGRATTKAQGWMALVDPSEGATA